MTGDRCAIRRATEADLPAIVAMLADDTLGTGRELVADLAPYRRAFADIAADPAQWLMVAVHPRGEVVGTFQLSIIPGLSRSGGRRGQIEAVRVRSDQRGGGLGAQMVAWAVEKARATGCTLVQLTTDKARRDAHRFYDRLGFVATHEGYKLSL